MAVFFLIFLFLTDSGMMQEILRKSIGIIHSFHAVLWQRSIMSEVGIGKLDK